MRSKAEHKEIAEKILKQEGHDEKWFKIGSEKYTYYFTVMPITYIVNVQDDNGDVVCFRITPKSNQSNLSKIIC